MSAKRTEYFTLQCDEPDCGNFIEAEDGGELVFPTVEEARRWADDMEWGREGDKDFCWEHRSFADGADDE